MARDSVCYPGKRGGKKKDTKKTAKVKPKTKAKVKRAAPVPAPKPSLLQRLKGFGTRAAPHLKSGGRSLAKGTVKAAKLGAKGLEALRDRPGWRINPMTGEMEYVEGRGKYKQG